MPIDSEIDIDFYRLHNLLKDRMSEDEDFRKEVAEVVERSRYGDDSAYYDIARYFMQYSRSVEDTEFGEDLMLICADFGDRRAENFKPDPSWPEFRKFRSDGFDPWQ